MKWKNQYPLSAMKGVSRIEMREFIEALLVQQRREIRQALLKAVDKEEKSVIKYLDKLK